MTVAELITVLQHLPQDLPVYVWNDWTDYPLDMLDIIEAEDDMSPSPGDSLARPRRLGLGGGQAY